MLQNRVTSRSAFIASLKAVIDEPSTQFFADTSFLIAVGTLHQEAREEVIGWLKGLGDRFKVPAWVAHELFGKISKETLPLTPMSRYASDAISALKLIQSEARRFVDDGKVAGFRSTPQAGLADRVGFLAELDRETAALLRRAGHLKTASAQALDDTTEALVELVNGRVLRSDVYADLRDVQAIHGVRLEGRMPPGTSDRKKDDNRYGDLIVWLEIVRGCIGLQAKGVVLLSNDVKPDWVFTPSGVLDEANRATKNETVDGFKVTYPQPSLVHELQQSIEDASLSLITLPTLAVLLHRELGGQYPNVFSAYLQAPSPPETPADSPPPEQIAQEGAQESPPEPARPLPSADLLRLISSDLPAQAVAGVSALRARLEVNEALPDAVQFGRALAEGVSLGVEPAAILVREILTGMLGQPSAADLVMGMYSGVYLDNRSDPRARPLSGMIDELFAVQAAPQFRGAVRSLRERLAGYEDRYLMVPDWNEPRVRLELSTERSPDGGRLLVAILHGDVSLTADRAADAPERLRTLVGADSTTVDELRRRLADHFRVPVSQIETNLTRTERIELDEIIGLSDWGPQTTIRLR